MASTDIQPLLDRQPPALPANVARVTADGRPTSHLIDWELFQTNWFKTNIIATDQRIDSVKAVAEEAEAAVEVESQARITADGALATQITTVSAKANQATANGQIFFAAKAGPAGSTAAFGLYLTAGNAFTGMEAIVKSDGTSAIGFSASNFYLNDSGAAVNVFNYTGGEFTFNVPVRVGTNDISLNAINSPTAAVGTSSVNLGHSTGGDWVSLLSATNTGGPGQIAIVHVDFEWTVFSALGAGGTAQWRLRRNDGKVLFIADLIARQVSIQRLDLAFNDTYTYRLEAFIDVNGPGEDPPEVVFTSRRGLMIDLRKR